MKKTILSRALFGIPVGISIGYIITIIISLFLGDGLYSPCVPELIEVTGSEINAVILQTVLCGLLGGVSAAASVIWEIDEWPIAKQTGIYFVLLSLTMLPIAYFTHWMEHSLRGFLVYFGLFLVIFIIMWLIQYWVLKNKVVNIGNRVNKN